MPLGLDHYAQTPDGLLLIANGMERMKVWDGLSAALEDAGLTAPASAPTVGSSSTGNINGEYTAYCRFVDARGNFSNFSPVSTAHTAQGATTGTITGASATTPIVITDATHGRSTGDVLHITGVQGNTDANGYWTITVLDADTFELDGSSSFLTYTSGGTWRTGVGQIDYTNIPVPTESKVVAKQILRNTAGQADVYYLDLTITNVATTTGTSTKTDAVLSAQVAVPLFNDDDSLNANSYGVPPSHKSVLAHHLGRMFAAVDVDYSRGCVSVTNGSPTVTGVGTDWPSVFAGRYLYLVGADKPYEISSVNTSTQVITLTANYAGTTDKFGVYAIRPAPGERRLLYYTEAGRPESWPSVNALAVQENGDELSGLMAFGAYLYILERRHIHRITFQENPGVDGAIFQVAVRGCLNNRCWVIVDDNAYFLDQAGVHSLSGGDAADALSAINQQLFQPNSGAFLWVNWQASDMFHAAHYPAEETVRWFVCLAGDRFPRHALCLDYRGKGWWVEEFPRPVTCSATGTYEGSRRVFFGSDGGKVFLLGQGTLDGVDRNKGTTRGTVTSAAVKSLTDTTATFPVSPYPLVGANVCIVAGRGKGQGPRRVVENTATTLYIDTPWDVEPDSTSVYQLGGVPWRWASRWMKYVESEKQTATKVGVSWKPTASAAGLTLNVHQDYRATALKFKVTRPATQGEGFAVTKDSADLVADMTGDRGYAQQRLDRHKEYNLAGARVFSATLSGVQSLDPVEIYRLVLEGATDR